ncbi:hypothetical protein [Castellaniella caeni]|uniref:hypothetical protein n=1 Tax=Castellaniella caeni TaxID=266123 RepID=UPI00082BE1D1|nr:hypothetical protein [Castellaniella caeni]
MLRVISTPIARTLGLSLLLVVLSACAQQREPGYYDTPRESTMTDALHRAQGSADTTAPSQLQFGFGTQEQKAKPASPAPAQAAPASAEAHPVHATASGAAAPTTAAPPRPGLPQELAETKTYLGTLACTDGGQCPASRLTLTLAPDGQWRARKAPAEGSGASQTALGCWFLTDTNPTRIVLQSGEHPYASLEFVQSNVLQVLRINGQPPLLAAHLTRQADLDPIDELAATPAQACPAQ